MGRVQAGIDPAAGPHLRTLVEYLRQLKDASGANFRELSKRTEAPFIRYCAASVLSEAVTGSRLPRLEVVDAYARAAHPLAEEQTRPHDNAQAMRAWEQAEAPARYRRAAWARKLWDAARTEQARRDLTVPYRRPRQVRAPAALAKGLRWLRAGAGQPTLREIEHRTAARGHRIPRTMCQQILAGHIVPTVDQLAALLSAFGVTGATAAAWRQARDRVQARRTPAPAAQRAWYGCADADPAFQTALERRERDLEIRRKTGRLRDDDDLDVWALTYLDENDWP